MAVTLHPEADAELASAVAHLNGAAPAAGLRFLGAIVATLEMLAAYPRAGHRISRKLRRFVMTDWPYVIVYEVIGESIHVVAVAHHSRKPNYWRKRLR